MALKVCLAGAYQPELPDGDDVPEGARGGGEIIRGRV